MGGNFYEQYHRGCFASGSMLGQPVREDTDRLPTALPPSLLFQVWQQLHPFKVYNFYSIVSKQRTKDNTKYKNWNKIEYGSVSGDIVCSLQQKNAGIIKS